MLPPEILNSLCLLLDVSSLKAVRQCSRIFAQEAARILFRECILYCTCDSIRRLTAIALDDTLRRYVRTILYVPNTYVPGLSFPQYQYWCNRDRPVRIGALIGYRNHFAEYEKFSQDQQQVLSYRQDAEVWILAYERFTHLEDVRLLMLEACKPDNGLLANKIRKTFMAPDREFNQRPDLVSTGVAGQLPRVEMFGYEQAKNVIQPLVDAARRRFAQRYTDESSQRPSRTQLTQLQLEGITPIWIHGLLTDELERSAVFAGITKLDIDFWCTKYEQTLPGLAERIQGLYHSLGVFIQTARMLKQIRLSIAPPNAFVSFTDLFYSDTSWPSLEAVEIEYVTPTVTEIADFWDRHGSILRSLIVRGQEDQLLNLKNASQSLDNIGMEDGMPSYRDQCALFENATISICETATERDEVSILRK